MKSKISICFLTIVVILLALVMIEKINTQRAADKAAIIAQSNENDKKERCFYYCTIFWRLSGFNAFYWMVFRKRF